jgi:pyruvate formate lyase activating enzyme
MVKSKLTTGRIFDIQGFSVHDGPGCRTVVFLKGCSLECDWCSNPEGISFFPEPLYRDSKCTFDALCVNACPHAAIAISTKGDADALTINRNICAKCYNYDCVKACCSGAINQGGYEITVENLYNTINRDRQYWGEGGGMTLTGGEPFAQPEFAFELLQRCYNAYIHTAVETCGNVPWENYEKSLPYIDWIFFDLKTMDESKSHQITGNSVRQSAYLSAGPFTPSPVALILKNARRMALEFPGRLVFRLPVIPGFNDDQENISETASFILSTNRKEINILPLHHMGREKYNLLGKKYYTTDFKIPDKDELHKIAHQFTSRGITCYVGSDTPF